MRPKAPLGSGSGRTGEAFGEATLHLGEVGLDVGHRGDDAEGADVWEPGDRVAANRPGAEARGGSGDGLGHVVKVTLQRLPDELEGEVDLLGRDEAKGAGKSTDVWRKLGVELAADLRRGVDRDEEPEWNRAADGEVPEWWWDARLNRRPDRDPWMDRMVSL